MKLIKYRVRYWIVRKAAKGDKPLKIILGAAETHQQGWYSTNQQWLDITKQTDWEKIFPKKEVISHVVAEHVFEHLTMSQTKKALGLIFQYLEPQGRIRIAVPDGFHPDPEYLKHVGINGIGADAQDHKQLLNMTALSTLLSEAGFQVSVVEGYTQNGKLINSGASAHNGFILRSRSNPVKINAEGWDFVDAQTSLIIDGIRSI